MFIGQKEQGKSKWEACGHPAQLVVDPPNSLRTGICPRRPRPRKQPKAPRAPGHRPQLVRSLLG